MWKDTFLLDGILLVDIHTGIKMDELQKRGYSKIWSFVFGHFIYVKGLEEEINKTCPKCGKSMTHMPVQKNCGRQGGCRTEWMWVCTNCGEIE